MPTKIYLCYSSQWKDRGVMRIKQRKRRHRTSRGSPKSVVVNVRNCDVVVNEYEIQSLYYVHFRTNTIWERNEPAKPSQLWVKSYHGYSPTIALVLDNPRRFICHLAKEWKQITQEHNIMAWEATTDRERKRRDYRTYGIIGNNVSFGCITQNTESLVSLIYKKIIYLSKKNIRVCIYLLLMLNTHAHSHTHIYTCMYTYTKF